MRYYLCLFLLFFWGTACQTAPTPTPPPAVEPTLTATRPAATATTWPTPLATPLPTATYTPPPPTPTAEPLCPRPENNMGLWCYPDQAFVHPIAFELAQNQVYLLDRGRVLQVAAPPAVPQLLLEPGSLVSDTMVIEPLDLAYVDQQLLVLDRAGDVYRYDEATQSWHMEWYDRTIGKTSSHYYVALATAGENRYLADASYSYGLRYRPDLTTGGWQLPPEEFYIDLAARPDEPQLPLIYLLTQSFTSQEGFVHLYQAGVEQTTFVLESELTRPLQLQLHGSELWVLDQAGLRLQKFAGNSGALVEQITLPEPISAFDVDEQGQLWLAGRSRVLFPGRPDLWAVGEFSTPLTGPQPHDLSYWHSLPPLVMPASGSAVPVRELRMPGAPRHYRLGVHEGLDFYWSPGKEVIAAADGVVIRATHDYTLPTTADFDQMRELAKQIGYSSPEILDFYRGRQVWVQHANGLVSRYVHLSEIAPNVVEGQAVTAGQLLGKVGNTGSPASVNDPAADAHLHFELWLGEVYVGQFLRPVEARYLWNLLFGFVEKEE